MMPIHWQSNTFSWKESRATVMHYHSYDLEDCVPYVLKPIQSNRHVTVLFCRFCVLLTITVAIQPFREQNSIGWEWNPTKIKSLRNARKVW